MSPIKNMPCWEIMQCSGTESCAARLHPDIPCWELSEKLGTGQRGMNICSECIVYIIKTNDTFLTPGELDDIMRYRNMVQALNCPVCDRKDLFIKGDGKKSRV